MPGGLSPLAVAGFIGAVVTLIALGLIAISLVLRAQRKHRKRLSRVSRRRMSGRFDIEDVRQSLIRAQEETSALEALTVRLANVVPLLDTAQLRANIARAGMSMSISTFGLASALVASVIAGIASLISGAPFAVLMIPGLFAGMFFVNAFVKLRGQMMANRFMKQLPEAIDTIIRGIRSGLPVIECIGTAGAESPALLGPHFRMISERVQVGEPLETALWRVAKVVDKPEMDFLAVAISIQMETGGSLSEALGNLGDLLRRREHMKLKIKAVSSEAKASALIIGALPFVMLGLLTVMSPDYVLPLFTDPRGRLMLAAGMGSILVGAFVMWRMTQFEI
jgi:tight adherence protein B